MRVLLGADTFEHHLLLGDRLDQVVVEFEPGLVLSRKDERVVVTGLGRAVMDQNSVQIVRLLREILESRLDLLFQLLDLLLQFCFGFPHFLVQFLQDKHACVELSLRADALLLQELLLQVLCCLEEAVCERGLVQRFELSS